MKRPLGAALAGAAITLALTIGTSSAATSCDLVASPSGSNANSGSASAPFKTAQKLVNSLSGGQTGCLEAGTYPEDVTFRAPGVTLTAYPGQTATVKGRMWVSNTASGVTVAGLNLDGANSQDLPSPTIDASNVTFQGDNVTDEHTAICFDVGSLTYGVATGTVITRNRIHDCGHLPALNHDHGIYVEAAVNTQISWNLIYDNADRGVQLYPDAQGTTIDHNIIAGNGEGVLFSGDFGDASSGTDVYDNVLADAVLRHDVESWYPSGNPIGQSNTVHNNCLWGGTEGTVDTSGGGFSASGNTVADPGFSDLSTGALTMSGSSPCLAIAGDVAAAVDGTQAVVASTGSGAPSKPSGRKPRRSGARDSLGPISSATSATPPIAATASLRRLGRVTQARAHRRHRATRTRHHRVHRHARRRQSRRANSRRPVAHADRA